MLLRDISVQYAATLVSQFHYSEVMPRITKRCYGWFDDSGKMVGVVTLGWGVRPLHTIQNAFPGLSTADYYEIGKLCLRPEMPHNSESQFLGAVIRALKKDEPRLKLLWTWADGILGKPGYIYQAANFYYGGYITTQTFLSPEGIKVHRRTMQGLSQIEGDGKRNSIAHHVITAMGYTCYYGKQFRYVYPLCGAPEWKRLAKKSSFEWRRGGYPKGADCTWEVRLQSGERIPCDGIPFKAGRYVKQQQPTLFDMEAVR